MAFMKTDEQDLGPLLPDRAALTAGCRALHPAALGGRGRHGDVRVDDPLHVLDWRLHGYRSAPTPEPEASLRLVAEAQQVQAIAEYGRTQLDAEPVAEDARTLAADVDQVDDQADRLKAEARRLRDAEVAAIKADVRVVDDDGLVALRALVLADADGIAADRQRYRQQLAESVTT
jgi:hypothetical protein